MRVQKKTGVTPIRELWSAAHPAAARRFQAWRLAAMALAFSGLFAVLALHLPRLRAADSGAPFTPDKGKFRILLNGSEIGTEEFEIAQDGDKWIARGDAVIKGGPGIGDLRSSGQLKLATDGSPVHYDWTAQTDKKVTGMVDFEDGTAKTKTNVPGKNPIMQDFHFDSPRIAVLDNNLYDQYALLARLYDWNAKGAQMFPVVIPQDVTPGMITVESEGAKSAAGGEFDALRVSTSDLVVDLFFDAKHHLARLEVPAAKVVIVRQ
jgi:hypothetical protein